MVGTRTFALQFVRTYHVFFWTQDAHSGMKNAIEVLYLCLMIRK